MAFAPGDIVQLKSGSPALTVISEAGETVYVVWYADETGEFHTQSLPAIALESLELTEFEEEEDEDGEDSED
ncbi:YodC family protein [Xanthobacteraceae bacterium A53D]